MAADQHKEPDTVQESRRLNGVNRQLRTNAAYQLLRRPSATQMRCPARRKQRRTGDEGIDKTLLNERDVPMPPPPPPPQPPQLQHSSRRREQL